MSTDPTTPVRVAMVDVYPVRESPAGLEALVLRRSPVGRSPGSWECVHGHIDDGETPVGAARRELVEETGYTPLRLYNLSRVDSFYSHRLQHIALIPAFVAVVDRARAVTLSREHDRSEWLPLADAARRVSWPRLTRGLADVEGLLGQGHAGALEDVLRIE